MNYCIYFNFAHKLKTKDLFNKNLNITSTSKQLRKRDYKLEREKYASAADIVAKSVGIYTSKTANPIVDDDPSNGTIANA